MTKIMVDTNLIDNSLINQAKTARTNITNTRQNAQKVNFPNDEYDWSNITSQISDCENALKKYINWISEVNNSYKNNIDDFLGKIDKIQINKLEFNTIDVK